MIDNLFEYEESYKSLTNLFRYDYFSIIEFFCESGECTRLSYENGKIQLFFENAIHLSSFSSDNIAKELIKYMENN